MKKRISLIILLFVHGIAFGQMQDYGYKRPIKEITDQWHKVELPLDVLSRLQNDLSDLRIYGVTTANDTVEAPYLLKVGKEVVVNEKVKFKVLNQTKKGNRHYISLRIPAKQTINKIVLRFNQRNFDWLVKIEGSNNQNDWFEIADKQRILSIKNSRTNYSFTDLSFGESQYEFYRISFDSDVRPVLASAETSRYAIKQSVSDSRSVNFTRVDDKKNKTTVLKMKLNQLLPIHKLSMKVASDFDYYRPIRIEYAADSFLTMKGTDTSYTYNYRTLFSGTLSSLESSVFSFSSTLIDNIRVTIYNGNNQPLDYGAMKRYTYKHELVARFTEAATYFLAYGNQQAPRPNYDIAMFENKIPKELSSLKLGNEVAYGQAVLEEDKQEPLFKNKAWLWAVMILVIGLLGWFTFRMMRKVDAE